MMKTAEAKNQAQLKFDKISILCKSCLNDFVHPDQTDHFFIFNNRKRCNELAWILLHVPNGFSGKKIFGNGSGSGLHQIGNFFIQCMGSKFLKGSSEIAISKNS